MKIFIASILFSQILVLGVFGEIDQSYYVLESNKNLCGEFTPGVTSSPNWLPDTWRSLEINSGDISTETYCKNKGYKYAGVPIGVSYISETRAGAEFLAGKDIIKKQNLNPQAYNLNTTITRKEMMKIISKLGNLNVKNTECKQIFADVINDWGCKYIESALEKGYIIGNEGFRPNAAITRSEALKLVFKSKNISKRYNTGTWQEDYISSAYYLGYLDQKFNDYNIAATRGWIFSLTAKTFSEFQTY